ncbi:MAG: PepSY-associated TM helix domain-containing protein [Thermoanaerobaculia bacterium]
MKLRPGIVLAHRWASLLAALFWLLQTATGTFAVFHWEIDDAMVAGASRPLDLAAIEHRAAELAAPGSGRHVDSIWSTAGVPNRFDIFLEATPPDRGRVVRVDGAGTVLRTRSDGERIAAGGLVDSVVLLHQTLLAGDAGKWIVGASGLLLLGNLAFGAVLAWPRPGQWGRALRPAGAQAGPARLYAWHRALGLWAMLPAACLVAAGVLLAFETTTERLVAASPVDPPAFATPAGSAPVIGMAEAVQIALARFPGAALSGIGFPSTASSLWSVRLRQADELRRAYGKTRVYVSAVDGRVVAEFDALASTAGRRLMDSLFSFHTGEMAGLPGRIAVAGIGIWLVTMTVLGLRLWSARRRLRRGRSH